jgi:hypothetical protein
MKTSLQIGCLYSLKSMANHDHLSSTAPDAWCQTTLYVPVLGQYLMAATVSFSNLSSIPVFVKYTAICNANFFYLPAHC